MYPYFGRICVLVILFQYTCEENMKFESHDEKKEVPLQCDPKNKGNIIVWFRLRENRFEFLASYTSNGNVKQNVYPQMFSTEKTASNILTLREFQKARDSGVYSCASFNNNMLNFGKATRIQGHPDLKPTIKTTVTTNKLPRPNITTSNTRPCLCQAPTGTKMKHPTLNCELEIFAPLAGGCGLLFLILIFTICYCNRIRTNRCPHHYKKKPKNHVPVRQAMPERYV
ncbi:hypothetical protein AAFF_G00030560 [Aldrovandia affinis]|uniref:Ig-like domain-containing protein n=1 Tax=Aldrovandia affinis TaxID=143900 RepID=A0AAD7S421_9TELE|nr:hypothetical protein AAFF_G00030560 [Aldrovandia affinis]